MRRPFRARSEPSSTTRAWTRSAAGGPCDRERAEHSEHIEYGDEQRDELVEEVAREIQLRGLTASAVSFLQASRPYRPLGPNAMLFFDPVLHGLFGGEL